MTSTLHKLLAQTSIGDIKCIGSYCPPVGTTNDPCPAAQKIEALFTSLFGFLTIVAGLAFLIYFVLGGVSWITAGGDTGNVDKAKKQMTNAAIGLIIIAAAYAITWIIGQVLGINILNFANSFGSIFSGGCPNRAL